MDGIERGMYWWYVTLDQVSAIGWAAAETGSIREEGTEYCC